MLIPIASCFVQVVRNSSSPSSVVVVVPEALEHRLLNLLHVRLSLVEEHR
jgi:hypothetical protein